MREIGVGSIPILSATSNGKGVIGMSREQILKLTSLSSCAG
jgi:hypothetical protein